MIEVGQIWQEQDPRVERFVRIESVGTGPRSIRIRTVYVESGQWVKDPSSRGSFASRERFNGKRGGYRLHSGSCTKCGEGLMADGHHFPDPVPPFV